MRDRNQKEPFVEGVYSQTISWSESDDIETQMTVIKSYAVFERAAERLGLIPRGSNPGDGKPLAGPCRCRYRGPASQGGGEQAKVQQHPEYQGYGRKPVFAQDLANAVALGYRELHGEQQTRRTREALRYIDDQLKEVRIKLREAEERFNRFSKENDLLSIDLQSENLVAQAQEIRKEKARTRGREVRV
jgi:polysaccharide biosynthesis transport protein